MESVQNNNFTIKLEGARNWNIWKFQTSVLLRGQGVYNIVDGTTVKPKDEVQRNRWEAQDAKAQTLLVTRMSEEVMLHIISCETSASMWQKLLSVYEQKSETSIHIIQQRFFQFKYDENSDMSVFLSKIQEMQNHLKQLGEAISDKFVITKILMSLPEDYKHFVSAWESAPDDKQTYDNLVARLLIEEERIKEKGGSSQSSAAFVAKKTNRKTVKCFKCNKLGHFISECRFNKTDDFRNSKDHHLEVRCYYCNKPGHLKSQCRFKKDKKGNAFVVMDKISESSAYFNKTKWLVDSGASEHMCCDYELFNSYCSAEGKSVIVGNGTQISVKGSGQVAVQVWNGNEWIDTTIDNVLHVPELSINLFSVNRATSKGYVIVTGENECKFYKENKVMAVAERNGSMYYLNFRYHNTSEANVAEVKRSALHEWHEKMAHQNMSYVKEVLKNNKVDINTQLSDSATCESCMKGKIHRLPYPRSENVSSRTCEIIHADTCGPMEESSIGGSRYFVVFKDDFSKYREVCFVKGKHEIKLCIRNFIARAENETGNRIKIFRTDNGTEFVNNEVLEMFQAKGIVHQTSVTFTPEQNGRAERENRILVEAARSMLFAKNLSTNLWAEAINTAAYVINRTGKSSVDGKTPYELWSNKTFDINNLKVFGTPVYVHIPKEKRRKWDPKGEKGILVGYGETTKGYRVFFPHMNTVETKRDMIFVKENKKQEPESTTVPCVYNQVEEFNPDDAEKEDAEDRAQVVEEDDNTLNTLESDPEGSLYEPSDSSEGENSENPPINHENKRVRKQTQFFTCNNVLVEDCEPKSYEEAMRSPEASEWKKAIQRELQTLKENNTWTVSDLPGNQKAISTKWVFKIKQNNNDIQYKARLVARGFEQENVLSYSEIYAPVAKLATFRLFIAIATKFNLPVYQMDVTGAFLYGEINESVYIRLPDGAYENNDCIVKLNKALYGLKKSPKYWNDKFNSVLIRENFKRSECDPCLYSKCNETERIYVLIYVDDLLIFGSNEDSVSHLKSVLKKEFKMKDLGLVSDFLGINVKQNLETHVTVLCQRNYLENVLKRFNMYECKQISTPMDQNFNVKELENNKCTTEAENVCRQIIGCLMYAACGTRPDICATISILSRYQDRASNMLLVALKRVLRYIKHTLDYKLIYNCNDDELVGFCDADWGGDLTDRKSTTGYCFKYANCLVSWCSKKQSTVSISSTEAEYVAMSMAGAEACWLSNMLCSFNIKNVTPAILFCDNQSAMVIANTNTVKRLKHIDIKYHFIRELIEKQKICLKYVKTEEQIADMLTKALKNNILLKFVNMCGLK